MPGIIIPRKTVLRIAKLVDEGDDEVQTELGETKIRFTVGGVVLTSKLIDGTFPDYHRVIPTGNDKKLVVDRRASPKRSTASRRSRPSAAARSSSSIDRAHVTVAVDQPG